MKLAADLDEIGSRLALPVYQGAPHRDGDEPMASDDRLWIPADYLDEVSPPGRASPDAWLLRLPDGRHGLAPDDDDDRDCCEPLDDGETVQFVWMIPYGAVSVVIGPDGTPIRDGPADATHFYLPYEPDTLAYSLREMVEAGTIGPGEHAVQCACWCERYVGFVYEQAHGRFRPAVETEAATPEVPS